MDNVKFSLMPTMIMPARSPPEVVAGGMIVWLLSPYPDTGNLSFKRSFAGESFCVVQKPRTDRSSQGSDLLWGFHSKSAEQNLEQLVRILFCRSDLCELIPKLLDGDAASMFWHVQRGGSAADFLKPF